MYSQQINELLSETMRADYMSDEEWHRRLTLTINNLGGYEKLNKEIEIGISNGYSVEQQFDIVRTVVDKLI